MEILPRQKWGSLLNNIMRPRIPIVSMGSLWPCFFFSWLIWFNDRFNLHGAICTRGATDKRPEPSPKLSPSEAKVGLVKVSVVSWCSVLFVCCFVWLVTWLVFLFCCMCVRLVGCLVVLFFFVCWFGLVGLLGWAVGSWMRKQQKLKGRFVGLPF